MISIITGGAGFIGSHLAEKLIMLGHKVIIIDNFSNGKDINIRGLRNKIKLIKADISKNSRKWTDCFKNANYVFHLAALADIVPSINHPRKYFDSNVVGTFNVLEACRVNKNLRILYAASSSCYGVPKKYPTKENSKISTKYPYALTKNFGEEMMVHWHQVYKLKTFTARLFNVYGERSRTSGTYGAVFGVFLAQKLAKKPFTIVGTGNQSRDFTYVTDVVSALIKIIKSKYYGEVFNIGSGETVSINKIVKLLGGNKKFIPKRPGEPHMTFANINKIKYKLGWKPIVKIEDGILKLLKNIHMWKNAPVWDAKKIKIATKDWFKYLK